MRLFRLRVPATLSPAPLTLVEHLIATYGLAVANAWQSIPAIVLPDGDVVADLVSRRRLLERIMPRVDRLLFDDVVFEVDAGCYLRVATLAAYLAASEVAPWWTPSLADLPPFNRDATAWLVVESWRIDAATWPARPHLSVISRSTP